MVVVLSVVAGAGRRFGWRDTRWRFFVGLGVLMLSGVSVVLIYPRVLALVPLVLLMKRPKRGAPPAAAH